MEVVQVLHMNEGDGEDSYAKNSAVQRKIISVANSIIKEAVEALVSNNFPESIGIADLGCSSGPNALMVISEIMDTIFATSHAMGRPPPELRVALNDLYGNDFNNVFLSLPAFYKKLKDEIGGTFEERFFISGVPGSFYGRLFGSKSMHFVHSSSSLHWLSQVPRALIESNSMNKGKLYLSTSSPPSVGEAYLSQFQNDFSVFLKSRSEEMVSKGRMVLSFMGRESYAYADQDSFFQWELLAEALMAIASEGLIEEEKIDSFNAPYYAPSPEELKHVVEAEGSFIIDRFYTFETYWNEIAQEQTSEFEKLSSGQSLAKLIRAVVESMLEAHFGETIMDELFRRYGEIMDDHLQKDKVKFISLIVSFTKRG